MLAIKFNRSAVCQKIGNIKNRVTRLYGGLWLTPTLTERLHVKRLAS